MPFIVRLEPGAAFVKADAIRPPDTSGISHRMIKNLINGRKIGQGRGPENGLFSIHVYGPLLPGFTCF